MEDVFASACQLLAPEVRAAVSLISAALGVLVLAVIALGFGPLRAWLGLASGRRPPASDVAGDDGGLLDTWRLYRQLGRDAAGTDFSVPEIRASIVPDEIIEPASDGPRPWEVVAPSPAQRVADGPHRQTGTDSSSQLQ